MKEFLSKPGTAALISAVAAAATTLLSIGTHYSTEILRLILSRLGG